MNRFGLVLLSMSLFAGGVLAQNSQRTKIQGNTEINATTNNMTAVAAGEGNVAKKPGRRRSG